MLNGIESKVMLFDKLKIEIVVFFVAGNVICGFKIGEKLKRVDASFVDPLVGTVEKNGIPQSPRCRQIIVVDEAVVVFDDVIGHTAESFFNLLFFVLVGTKIGAGNIEEGKSYAKRFLLLAPIMGFILGALLIPLRTPVLSLFDISPAAHRTAMMLLLFYAVDLGLRNIPYFLVVGIFRAGGDTRIGLIVDIISMYGIVLPLVALCGLVWQVPFLWTYLIMLAADDLSKMVLYIPRFVSMKWIQPVSAEDLQAAE